MTATSASSSSSPPNPIDVSKFAKRQTDREAIVLVACGSYSPLTNMHLRIFEQARDHLNYGPAAPVPNPSPTFDTLAASSSSSSSSSLSTPSALSASSFASVEVIGGIVSPVHDAYGKKSLIRAADRVTMCQLAAAAGAPWIVVSDWETKQAQWNRTALTLTAYQRFIDQHNLPGGARVSLLCGADLLESFLIPNLWSEEDMALILGRHGVVVIERLGGTNLTELINSTPILNKHAHHILIVPQKIQNTISSTHVRELFGSSLSARYLLPDPVIDYIVERGLYGVDTKLYRERHMQIPASASNASSTATPS